MGWVRRRGVEDERMEDGVKKHWEEEIFYGLA
jgi:hypothetical protein